MKINKTDNINFKSNYHLDRPLNKIASKELIKDFHLFINPNSPFTVNSDWTNKGVTELLSIIDSNDHLVEKYFKHNNILFKKGLSAVEHFKKTYSKFGSKNLTNIISDFFIKKQGWEVPKRLIDKLEEIG